MRVARSVWILLARSISRLICFPRPSMSTSRRVTRSPRLSGIRRGGVFIGIVAQDVELLSPRVGPAREATRAAFDRPVLDLQRIDIELRQVAPDDAGIVDVALFEGRIVVEVAVLDEDEAGFGHGGFLSTDFLRELRWSAISFRRPRWKRRAGR